jgi:hypothetical protein
MRILGGQDHPIFSKLYLPECVTDCLSQSRLSRKADLVWFYLLESDSTPRE